MRRDVRKKIKQEDELNIKIIKYSVIGISILTIIVLALLIYSKKLNNDVKEGTLTSEQISSILNNTKLDENTESASSEIGKNINEVKNEISQNSTENNVVKEPTNTTNANVLTTKNVKSQENEQKSNTSVENNTKSVELNFEKPVDGEIVRDFAMDNLIYSDTLQEWTTHSGIDIKADKTTVVKSAEAGTVKTIKNDPRYGLTIVVEHENGLKLYIQIC